MARTARITRPHRFNRKQGTPCAYCTNDIHTRDDAATVEIRDGARVISREVVHRSHADDYIAEMGL